MTLDLTTCQTHRKAIQSMRPATTPGDTPAEQTSNVLPLRKEVRYDLPMTDEDIARTWSTYVNRILANMTDVEASERVPSVSARTFGNWRNPDKCRPPDPRKVVDFADRFGQSRSEALAEAGLPVDIEISGPQAVVTFDQMSRTELLEQQGKINDELLRRERDGGLHPQMVTRERRRRRRSVTYDPSAPPV